MMHDHDRDKQLRTTWWSIWWCPIYAHFITGIWLNIHKQNGNVITSLHNRCIIFYK